MFAAVGTWLSASVQPQRETVRVSLPRWRADAQGIPGFPRTFHSKIHKRFTSISDHFVFQNSETNFDRCNSPSCDACSSLISQFRCHGTTISIHGCNYYQPKSEPIYLVILSQAFQFKTKNSRTLQDISLSNQFSPTFKPWKWQVAIPKLSETTKDHRNLDCNHTCRTFQWSFLDCWTTLPSYYHINTSRKAPPLCETDWSWEAQLVVVTKTSIL